MAYRAQMGVADAGDARQAQGRRRQRDMEEAGGEGEEEEYPPGMTILRDPKVRAQLDNQRIYRPYFLILCTVVQCVFLIYEMYFNSTLFGSWIDPPASNWMIGPNSRALIKLGAMYSPCIVPTYLWLNQGICPPALLNSTNGTFFSNGNETAYCGDLGDLCGMGGFPGGSPDQWWRFFTAIFAHGGVIHLVVNMVVQIRLGFAIERSLGPLRTIFIYFSSGFFGYLLSAIFNKSAPSMGCDGALFGLVAVLLIDLLQNWRLVKNPKRQ